MKIVDLKQDDKEFVEQAAQILVSAFAKHFPDAWPTLEDAYEELEECLESDKVVRIALDESNKMLGWIGGRPVYDGNVWELHPLAVAPNAQRQGIGRALVADLEEIVRAKGAMTVYLGGDDESNQTTLGGIDVYPNLLEKIAQIKNLNDHQYTFYEKCGYQIVGILPDANGFGKPDIFMAKRVGSLPK